MFSMSIYRTYKDELADDAKALNNISSGKKLESAKDNPYKIGKSESLKIQVLTSDAANKNIQDTNSMIQTFDGALQEINNSLVRMKQLTVSSGDGALTAEDKKTIQNEMDSIKADIRDLANNTEFNGVKLNDSSLTGLTGENVTIVKAAIGNSDDETMDIPFYNIGLDSLGIKDVSSNDPNTSNEAVEKAIKTISALRSKYGSIQNRLEGTGEYLTNKANTMEKVQSNIGDADIAEEMMNYSKSGILIQSSIALMAQSNNFPKDALNILANVK
jgi:flagellin